jgi:hypothetical protein
MTKISWGIEPVPCPADLGGSCGVDFIDFALFARYWLNDCTVDICGQANLNGNGAVNAEDLSIFAQSWLCGK